MKLTTYRKQLAEAKVFVWPSDGSFRYNRLCELVQIVVATLV